MPTLIVYHIHDISHFVSQVLPLSVLNLLKSCMGGACGDKGGGGVKVYMYQIWQSIIVACIPEYVNINCIL